MVNGTITEILTQKENDWGRYRLKDNVGKTMLLVGVIPGASCGMTVTVEGREVDTQYGRQFKISSVLRQEADKYAWIRSFLSKGYVKNIGPTKADAMIVKFGEKAISLFDTPEGRKALTEVKGLGIKTIEKALPSYEKNKKYLPIVKYLNGQGTCYQIEKIYERYGEKAISSLKRNPYILTEIDGFGFRKADDIAIAAGMRPDSLERMIAGMVYCLQEGTTEGHCFLTKEELASKLVNFLVKLPETTEATKDSIIKALDNWVEGRETFIEKHPKISALLLEEMAKTAETRTIIRTSFPDAFEKAVERGVLINDADRVYEKKMYETECECAKTLVDMLHESPVRTVTDNAIKEAITRAENRKNEEIKNSGRSGEFKITEEQKAAIEVALKNRVSIISGGPGRGKTAISEIVADAFMSVGRIYDKNDIIMIAPTGRAAQRITESTGFPAMTVHRAVLRDDKPCKKLVLCDESSMIDIFLLKKILDFAKDSNIIFVGDKDQIASVGPGQVLCDMIRSKVIPTAMLTSGHRNTGTIAKNAAKINAGIPISDYIYDEHFVRTDVVHNKIDQTISDWRNKQYEEDERFVNEFKGKLFNDYAEKVRKYGIKNVMLCAATRERGKLCVDALNRELQQIYAGRRESVKFGNSEFHVGDRVMQTKNDYDIELITIVNGVKERSKGVFNGERGTVARIKDMGDNGMCMVVQFDNGAIACYGQNTAKELTLAYVTTIHKCQGSEADCMMMVYTFADYVLLRKSLFYTGETRAKKEFCFYGEVQYKYGRLMSAFDAAVNNNEDKARNTFLTERIKNAVAA